LSIGTGERAAQPASGVLRGIRAQHGDTIPVGEPVAYIAAPDEDFEPTPIAAPERTSVATPAGQHEASPLPGPVTTTTLGAVLATPVAIRVAAENGVDLSKVPPSGPGRQVTRRDVEAYLNRQMTAAPIAFPPVGFALATPIVRRLAQEHGIDLEQIHGSGPDGLVVERDLRVHLTGQPTAGEKSSQPLPDIPIRERYPLEGRRKIIAQRMTQSARDAPHITLDVDINMREAENRRKNASLTAYITWATAQVLTEHSLLNATLHNGEIIIFDTVNMGIAVDTEEGLIVPVIHDAQGLSLEEIDTAIRDLMRRAREDQLSLDDVSGGTFTISNLGMLAVDRFEAIINPPQAAIMAVGRVRWQPWARDEKKVSVEPVMTVSLSADHRILDGAVVARFLQSLQTELGGDV
jgi:pyruvate dehydrogenase E2 component (dihydrolipoamide acetyltransferase)